VPKRWQSLTKDELREVHLALALRISLLTTMDTTKMGPSAKATLTRQVDVCTELVQTVQEARGK
jgi:hypothetical protein